MVPNGEAILLRVYLRSADRAPHMPTYERLVKAARKGGFAGATVLEGILGFGSRGLLRPSAWSLAENRPVIVEIADRPERIAQLIAGPLDAHMPGGLATLERAHVVRYQETASTERMRLGDLLSPLSTVPPIERNAMRSTEPGVLLRIFIGESDRVTGQPLYDAIVRKARELGLAGATVLRGIEGFGAKSVVHKTKLLEMSSDLPIVIELVDTDSKIQLLLPHLEALVSDAMVTMEHVVIIMYRHQPPAA